MPADARGALTLPRSRAVPFGVIALLAALLALLLTSLPTSPQNVARADDANRTHAHEAVAPMSPSAAQFQDQMRKLWEDHVTWTRLAIVTFAAGSGGFDSTAGRLLQNQTDIGNAIKPFYGDAAGDQLTALLNDHILIAVDLMQAAKDGDTDAFNTANAAWQDNANQIADMLSAANPKNWPQDVMRSMMQAHLTQTLDEAAHELAGQYEAGIRDYEIVHEHILAMADALSTGIVKQFPRRFR